MDAITYMSINAKALRRLILDINLKLIILEIVQSLIYNNYILDPNAFGSLLYTTCKSLDKLAVHVTILILTSEEPNFKLLH